MKYPIKNYYKKHRYAYNLYNKDQYYCIYYVSYDQGDKSC